MTSPEEAITVGELRDKLSEFDDDAPVVVAASGAYDFVAESSVSSKTLTPEHGGGNVPFIDGDIQ